MTTFCGLKQAQQLFLLCGGKNKFSKKNLNATHYENGMIENNTDKLSETQIQFENEFLANMSKNITLIDIKQQHSDMYKVLNNCSLTKKANIPMICVRSFKPTDLTTSNQVPSISNGIKIFTNSVRNKQIDIYRGMTILALFRRDDWLYIETAERECGYVPIDTCKPIGGRHIGTNDVEKTQFNNNNNKTSVSLMDVTVEQQSSKQYEVTDESSANNMYMYKMKHYFRSLDPIDKYDNENFDSGYSDTDSTTNHVMITTTTTTIQNTRDGPIKRAGIKTNGSIPIITSNININIRHDIQQCQQTITTNNEIRIDNKTKIANLSTIVEQSCNNTCTSNSIIEKKRCDLATTSQIEYKKTSLTNLCSNSSQLQLIPSPNSDSLLHQNNNMRTVICDYEPEFVDDLRVSKDEHVTLLDDENNDWIYVVSQNGKGYIPRSCVYY